MDTRENIMDIPLSLVVDLIIGRTVKVIKDDYLDVKCDIADELRWHIGDDFIVRKIVIEPWGCFLRDKDAHSLNIERAELVVNSVKKW